MLIQIGYLLGPNGENSNEYGIYSCKNSILPDDSIGFMYYPKTKGCAYYLASPSGRNNNYSILRVLVDTGNNGCFISYTPSETSKNCLCPIICLSPDSELNIEN